MFENLDAVCRAVDRFLQESSFPGSCRPESVAHAVADYPCRGGKRLRPALVLWSCGALGGDPQKALVPACALEVLHNWTLVHDDVIDNDDTRRGNPTCHVALAKEAQERFSLSCGDAREHGVNLAILAGDLQHDWAFSLLQKAGFPPAQECALTRALLRASQEVISGEALDVEFALRPLESFAGPEEVLAMYGKKTGALFVCGAELGSICAGMAETPAAQVLQKAMADFALAFQIQDDLLGIFGNTAKFGKVIGSDLREKKPTSLFLDALSRLDSCGREKLLRLCGRELSCAELDEARALLEDCDAFSSQENLAQTKLNAAQTALQSLPDTPYRRALMDLAARSSVRVR